MIQDKVGKVQRYWLQFKILMRKNVILSRRNWTWLALLTPIFLVLLLFLINIAFKESASQRQDVRNPTVKVMDNLNDVHCKNRDDCTLVAYYPESNPEIREIMNEVADWYDIKIKGYNSEDELTQAHLDNPKDMYSAVIFDVANNTVGGKTINYKIYYDTTYFDITSVYPVQRAIDGVLASYLSGKFPERSTINANSKNYPLVYKRYNNETDAAAALGPLLFFFPPVILLFIFLYQIVQEKENKLRQGMNLMGLKSSMFWSSWFFTAQAFNVLMTLCLIFSGMAFQFDYFLNANFMVNFFLFFTFGSAMIAIAFFLSTIIHRANVASNVGMAVLLVGFILQLILGSQFVLYALFNENAAEWVHIVRWILTIFFPPFNFSKCYVDIASKAGKQYDASKDQYEKGPGFHWSDLYDSEEVNNIFYTVKLPTTSTVMWYLVMQMAIYTVLTWYFDNIVPGPNGSPKSFYFFLTPRYWGFHSRVTEEDKLPLIQNQAADPDVMEERQKAMNKTEGTAVRILNLCKTYRDNPFFETDRDVRAVKNVYLTINNGECFCVLGHNGSGKTTMINTLNGLFYPTQGTAFIYGNDILYDMDSLRQVMGVCPQHDILWPELTAREHLELFAEFKGVDAQSRDSQIDRILKEVGLFDVGNDQARTFSGGMKRRLSVAISSIGDPKLIFMDEPTTGLDPMSKRSIWELIQEMKKNRVIFLTTHSLEEADVLSDKIAIMSYGEIKCVGTPLHLKTRYGTGYRLNILTTSQDVNQVKQIVQKNLADAEPWAENAGNLTFKVPPRSLDAFAAFCELLEKGAFSIIKDWGISQTTLEDVFLRVTAEGNFRYASVNQLPPVQYIQQPTLVPLNQQAYQQNNVNTGHYNNYVPGQPR